MIYNEIIPHYLALGVGMKEIRHSTINTLKFYDEAYRLKRLMNDERDYFKGLYNYEAVAVALGNAFRGKHKKPIEYRKKPILAEWDDEQKQKEFEKNLTEQQKEYYRNQLFANLTGMQEKFEQGKKKNGSK